jgi:hypothetical protein
MQAFLLRAPVQQFDALGNFLPEAPNKRSFEVLSSLDFYTTLGTGKMGGQLYPGTPLDVGYTENTVDAATRLPENGLDPRWATRVRAFTEGQTTNTVRAGLALEILSDTNLVTGSGRLQVTISRQDFASILIQAGLDYSVGTSAQEAAFNLAAEINARTNLANTCTARAVDRQVLITAVPPGEEGNLVRVTLNHTDPLISLEGTANLVLTHDQTHTGRFTSAYLAGGSNKPVNAGNGWSILDLTGLTERLPLGVLLQDSDFLCEHPLRDNASALKTSPAGIHPMHDGLPLTTGGEEYSRFLGEPGALIVLADGKIAPYSWAAYNDIFPVPGATKRFRIYRGGGAAFMLSGTNPGGPVDWVADGVPSSLHPVLKGGVLACRALLVRNFPEEASPGPFKTSDGDEIQMLVLTYGSLGDINVSTQGIPMNGIISPSGYGEGYAAADRYRVKGRLLERGYSRETPHADIQIAAYPEGLRDA